MRKSPFVRTRKDSGDGKNDRPKSSGPHASSPAAHAPAAVLRRGKSSESLVEKREDVVGGEYEKKNIPDVRRVRIRDVLATNHLDELLSFARKSCNQDSVLFYALADAYEKCDDKSRAALARHILECYLQTGAEREINVASRMRTQVQERYNKGDLAPDLFREPKLEVENLMDSNLDGFLDGKRGFWKKSVAWGAMEKKEAAAAAAAAAAPAVAPETKPPPDTTPDMATLLSGGNKEIERRMRGSKVGTVDQFISLIVNDKQ